MFKQLCSGQIPCFQTASDEIGRLAPYGRISPRKFRCRVDEEALDKYCGATVTTWLVNKPNPKE